MHGGVYNNCFRNGFDLAQHGRPWEAIIATYNSSYIFRPRDQYYMGLNTLTRIGLDNTFMWRG